MSAIIITPGSTPSHGGLYSSLDWKTITLASIGGGLEFYDFIVYGIFAQYIAATFFPSADPAVSLVSTFAVFAVGYLSRPLGGIAISHIGDRFGRRLAFLLTLTGMTGATLAMALIPSHSVIGVTATVLFVVLRFVQGCCVGGELPGAITYVVEAAPKRAGLACAVMFFCVNTGSFLATLVSSALHSILTPDQMVAYGWRIGFAIGGALGVVGFFLRRNLHESAMFRALGEHKASRLPVLEVLRFHWAPILVVIGIVGINQAFIAVLNVALAPYLTQVAGITALTASSVVAYAIGILSLAILVVGYASDFIHRRRILQAGMVLLLVGSYPLFAAILAGQLSLFVLFTIAPLACSLIAGTFGAVVSELFPTRLRFSGLAVAYNVAAAMVGGFAPLVTAWLMLVSGNKAAPGIFLSVLAAMGLFATLFLARLAPEGTTIER